MRTGNLRPRPCPAPRPAWRKAHGRCRTTCRIVQCRMCSICPRRPADRRSLCRRSCRTPLRNRIPGATRPRCHPQLGTGQRARTSPPPPPRLFPPRAVAARETTMITILLSGPKEGTARCPAQQWSGAHAKRQREKDCAVLCGHMEVFALVVAAAMIAVCRSVALEPSSKRRQSACVRARSTRARRKGAGSQPLAPVPQTAR